MKNITLSPKSSVTMIAKNNGDATVYVNTQNGRQYARLNSLQYVAIARQYADLIRKNKVKAYPGCNAVTYYYEGVEAYTIYNIPLRKI